MTKLLFFIGLAMAWGIEPSNKVLEADIAQSIVKDFNASGSADRFVDRFFSHESDAMKAKILSALPKLKSWPKAITSGTGLELSISGRSHFIGILNAREGQIRFLGRNFKFTPASTPLEIFDRLYEHAREHGKHSRSSILMPYAYAGTTSLNDFGMAAWAAVAAYFRTSVFTLGPCLNAAVETFLNEPLNPASVDAATAQTFACLTPGYVLGAGSEFKRATAAFFRETKRNGPQMKEALISKVYELMRATPAVSSGNPGSQGSGKSAR